MNTKRNFLVASDFLKVAFAKKILMLTPSASSGESQPPFLVTEKYQTNRNHSVKELDGFWVRPDGMMGSSSLTRWRKVAATMGGVLSIFLLLSFGEMLTGGQVPNVPALLTNIFAAGLASWTMRQYERKYVPLTNHGPDQLRLSDASRAALSPPQRWAA